MPRAGPARSPASKFVAGALPLKAAIVGLAGPTLLAAEAELLRDAGPAGVILFGRNVETPEQLRALTAALRAALPEGAVIAVDQEGGRVARLRPPHWRAHPPAAVIGALYRTDPAAGRRAAWLTGALLGQDCAASAITVACAPVLDLQVPGASDVVGDRSFGGDPAAVAALGLAVADGLLAAGVIPVAKHAPGHGRALVDSHHALPSVPADQDLTADLAPFMACAGLPWMMTAHLLYHGFDSQRPGTLSPVVIEQVIRGRIGFKGVLVSDDLAMHALSGEPGALAAAAIAAGCDLALHCTGRIDETADVLRCVPPASPATLARLNAGHALAAARRTALDCDTLAAERDRLLA
ncbi:MAG: beta-N-acetylhexosaminidase [Acetobacteraceae bacterium]